MKTSLQDRHKILTSFRGMFGIVGQLLFWPTRILAIRIFLFIPLVLGLASVLILCVRSESRGVTSTSGGPKVSHQLRSLILARNQRADDHAPTIETVMLTSHGFEPKQIEHSGGKFVLGIDNQIKPEEFAFEIVQENGHKVRQLKMSKGQIRVRTLVNLQAGRYSLTVVDHPEWTCSIVIIP